MPHITRLTLLALANLMLVAGAPRCLAAQQRDQDPPPARRDDPAAGDRGRDRPAAVDPPRKAGRLGKRSGDGPRRPDGPPRGDDGWRGGDRPGFPRSEGPAHGSGMGRPGPPGYMGGPERGRVLRGGPRFRPGSGIGYALSNDLEHLKQIDPEMFELERRDRELERRSLELSMQYRRASPEQIEALAKQVSELVGEHFEVRQKRRELQLKRLEDELKQLRSTLERRAAAREQIIQKRVSELTGKEDPLDF